MTKVKMILVSLNYDWTAKNISLVLGYILCRKNIKLNKNLLISWKKTFFFLRYLQSNNIEVLPTKLFHNLSNLDVLWVLRTNYLEFA